MRTLSTTTTDNNNRQQPDFQYFLRERDHIMSTWTLPKYVARRNKRSRRSHLLIHLILFTSLIVWVPLWTSLSVLEEDFISRDTQQRRRSSLVAHLFPPVFSKKASSRQWSIITTTRGLHSSYSNVLSSSSSSSSNNKLFVNDDSQPSSTTTTNAISNNETFNTIDRSPLSSSSSTIKEADDRPGFRTHFLLFEGGSRGQGAGNHLQGLLAAHLLALEFHRTVCILWDDFWEAFEYVDMEYADLCQFVFRDYRSNKKRTRFFAMWNYGPNRNIDECLLHDALASPNHRIVKMSGNTYPGWPTNIPRNLFHGYYRAKKELLNVLPYDRNIPPKVVVHLRFPDGPADSKRGLDDESLQYLGEMLRGNRTYLVTNRPDWYQRFHECCGWSYDQSWINKPIQHGAIDLVWYPNGLRKREKTSRRHGNGRRITSGTTTNRSSTNGQQQQQTANESTGNPNLKLWSDWYTMLTAEKVYHSNSDFSRSAVHWNADCVGYQLAGMATSTDQRSSRRTLRLVPAPYDAVSIRIPPLMERMKPTKVHSDDACVYLRFCKSLSNQPKTTSKEKGNMHQRRKVFSNGRGPQRNSTNDKEDFGFPPQVWNPHELRISVAAG